MISIHAPRMGSDYPITITPLGISAFQSTLPGWGATRRHNHGGQTRGDFNPRSPDGERRAVSLSDTPPCDISIHAPRMGSDRSRRRYGRTVDWISIHAPRMGSDTASQDTGRARQDFNPRSPDGERRAPPRRHSRTGGYFNPRSPDGERQRLSGRRHLRQPISIHAPRMGSDVTTLMLVPASVVFQSTLPGWGATATEMTTAYTCVISIHAPRMGSDRRDGRPRTRIVISIHAPRMGSDTSAILPSIVVVSFQSTLPGWGATVPVMPWDAGTRISIHAPRMGSDCGVPFLGYVLPYFNPRSPDGERLTVKTYIVRIRHFNPRSPDGERPDYRHSAGQVRYISIHAPRMGSDPPCFNGTVSSTTFQSTLPGWGATIVLRHQIVKITISIHAPRMGSDRNTWARIISASDFNPRSPDGERRNAAIRSAQVRQISIHAPRMGSDTNVDTRRLLPC